MATRSSNARPSRDKSRQATGQSRRERQIVRILSLLKLLAQSPSLTIQELAAKFHTRRETIYRDLRTLEDAGYPIGGDERGRLARPRLLPSPVPDIQFSTQELDALLFAAVQAQSAAIKSRALSSATYKLKALAESKQNSTSVTSDEMFDTWNCGAIDYRAHQDHIDALVEAILRKQRCRVTYRKPSSTEPKTYDYDPYRLMFVDRGLYVVGSVPAHMGTTTTLAIDRLQSVVLSRTEFAVAPDFDPLKCRHDAFGVSWEDPTQVVLRFRPDQAPYVRERNWHPSQKIDDLPGGAIQLSFRAGGPFEIRRWILGWGDAVEVISPESLRLEVGHLLKQASFAYRS